jgi:hypothetical protein
MVVAANCGELQIARFISLNLFRSTNFVFSQPISRLVVGGESNVIFRESHCHSRILAFFVHFEQGILIRLLGRNSIATQDIYTLLSAQFGDIGYDLRSVQHYARMFDKGANVCTMNLGMEDRKLIFLMFKFCPTLKKNRFGEIIHLHGFEWARGGSFGSPARLA